MKTIQNIAVSATMKFLKSIVKIYEDSDKYILLILFNFGRLKEKIEYDGKRWEFVGMSFLALNPCKFRLKYCRKIY